MKKVLLILLMLVLPWQAIAAAERNLTHVLGNGTGHGPEFVIKHIAEHTAHVPHHHDHDDNDDDDDSDGATHVDNSQKSFQHLADYEQGCNMNILLPALQEPCLPAAGCIAPAFSPGAFPDRTTIPLLRPPRAFA